MHTSKYGRLGPVRSVRPKRAERPESGGDTSKAAKIGLVSAVIVALITAVTTIVVAFIGKGGGTPEPAGVAAVTASPAGVPVPAAMPAPTCATCVAGGTFPEQAGTDGAETFRNPLMWAGHGQRVAGLQPVRVICRFYQPDASQTVFPGWWYLLATAPWNGQYYSPANSYLNGDPPQGPGVTYFDSGVPGC
jgi:hypothetical protein